eukprot:388296-Rhodomonas_salina.1
MKNPDLAGKFTMKPKFAPNFTVTQFHESLWMHLAQHRVGNKSLVIGKTSGMQLSKARLTLRQRERSLTCADGFNSLSFCRLLECVPGDRCSLYG